MLDKTTKLRNKLILKVFYDTGVRNYELTNLIVKDFKFK